MNKYTYLIIFGKEINAVIYMYSHINLIPNCKYELIDRIYTIRQFYFTWLFFKVHIIIKNIKT